MSNMCRNECKFFYNEPSFKNLGNDILSNDKDDCGRCMYWNSTAINSNDCFSKDDKNCCNCNTPQLEGQYNYCGVSSCLIKQMEEGKQQPGCMNTFNTHFGNKNPHDVYRLMNCNKITQFGSIKEDNEKKKRNNIIFSGIF